VAAAATAVAAELLQSPGGMRNAMLTWQHALARREARLQQEEVGARMRMAQVELREQQAADQVCVCLCVYVLVPPSPPLSI
jgi:hypothetical protein